MNYNSVGRPYFRAKFRRDAGTEDSRCRAGRGVEDARAMNRVASANDIRILHTFILQCRSGDFSFACIISWFRANKCEHLDSSLILSSSLREAQIWNQNLGTCGVVGNDIESGVKYLQTHPPRYTGVFETLTSLSIHREYEWCLENCFRSTSCPAMSATVSAIGR